MNLIRGTYAVRGLFFIPQFQCDNNKMVDYYVFIWCAISRASSTHSDDVPYVGRLSSFVCVCVRDFIHAFSICSSPFAGANVSMYAARCREVQSKYSRID